ncbi:MAG TPA: hypothetical protein VII75_08835 [Thermoanaerobaculia bacterium]|nr:hypothetical protein [Thermoanaerobaculia bacterium]
MHPRLPLLCAMVVSVAAALHAATITGTVRSDSGPILNAFITVSDEQGRVIVRRSAIAGGRIAVRFSDSVRVVTCLFEADGFEPRPLTLDVVGGTAAAGQVRLARTPGMTIGRPDISVSGDGKENRVDFVITNDAGKKILVRQVALQARQREKENCLDLTTPDVVIAVSALTTLAQTAIQIETAKGNDARKSDAHVSTGKCGQLNIDITTGITYQADKQESHRLRFVFPREAKLPGEQTAHLLDVDKWPFVQVTITTDDNRQYTSP